MGRVRIAIGLGAGVLVMTALASGLGRAGARDAPPQNLVLISIDTLRADHLGMHGYRRDTSPHLDRFARRSTRFAQAVAHAPNTPPSQLSLLTSLYHSVHGFSGHAGRFAPEHVTLQEILQAEGFTTAGFVDGGYLDRAFGFADGFAHFEDEPVHLAAILERADRWLTTAGDGRFFLFLHCYDVHSPYAPPAPYDRLFVDPDYDGGFTPTNDNLAAVAEGRAAISAADAAHAAALYDGAIRYVDAALGRFLEGLERRGLLASTVVVVTSDHGEEFLEHGSVLHWQTYYRPNLHVPLIVRVPGARPRVVDGPVEQIDVLPSVLELLGLPPHPDAMGTSLAGLVRGAPATRDAVAYAEPWKLDLPWRTLVSARWQFRLHRETDAVELFDLAVDPVGTVNVAGREPEVVARFRAAYAERQSRIEAVRTAGLRPAPATEPLSADTRARLAALGYLDRTFGPAHP